MTAARPARPAFDLTRHFLQGFFRVGFLTDAGADSLVRALIASLAALFTIGLWLPRMYAVKYVGLSILNRPEPYLNAVAADRLVLLTLPMLIVGVVTAVVGHSLFPDETDHRVLGALPMLRRQIFVAKLSALGLFIGFIGVVAIVSTAPVYLFTIFGRWAAAPWFVEVLAHLVAASAGVVFASSAVIAIHGLFVVFAPPGWLQPASILVRTMGLSGAVLSLPLVARMPAYGEVIGAEAPLLFVVPPAWFLGMERVLAGTASRYFVELAICGAVGLALVLLVGMACYARLYYRFEQLVMRPPTAMVSWSARWSRGDRAWFVANGPRMAVHRFLNATLGRSGVHQLIFVGGAAFGVAWMMNSLLAAGVVGWAQSGGEPPLALQDAATSAPFVLMFFTILAARASMLFPLELRANWVFRMSDLDGTRPHQLAGVDRGLLRLAVTPAVAAALPVGLWILGPRALVGVPIAWLVGAIFVEILLADWRRLPFSCSYVFGKRQLAHTLLVGLIAFVLFVNGGAGLVNGGFTGARRLIPTLAVLLGVVAALARRRQVRRGREPLEFEDDVRAIGEVRPILPL